LAYVETVELRGKSRWQGDGQGLSYQLAQQIQAVLALDDVRPWWSKRAVDRLEEIRFGYPWLHANGTVCVPGIGALEWWTFAGKAANQSLAGALSELLSERCTSDDLHIRYPLASDMEQFERGIRTLMEMSVADIVPFIDDKAIEGLKFSECLPHSRAIEMLQARLTDAPALQATLGKEVSVLAGGPRQN